MQCLDCRGITNYALQMAGACNTFKGQRQGCCMPESYEQLRLKMKLSSKSTTESLLLVIVILAVCCQADADWKKFDHYSTGGDAITSLDLDHLTGHVYLCNETTVCHLNQHLQEQECASTDVPCLFLKVEQHHRYLFVGGATSHVRSLRNVESVVQVLDNPLSVFSECNGTHGLPCYTLVLGSDKDDKSVFFIGSSHGVNVEVNVAASENTTYPFISSRKLTWNEDQGNVVMKFAASDFDTLSSRMSRENFKKMMSNNMKAYGAKAGYSALYVANKYSDNLEILHVYSFRHQGFVYFVTNQRSGESAFKVYLTRICQSDSLFSSYISVELKYVSPEKGSYSFAQMAYFHSAANEELSWLYVFFRKHDISKNTTNLNHQVVAGFSLSDINEVLDKTEHGCFGLNTHEDRRYYGDSRISPSEYHLEQWLYRPVKVSEHQRSLGNGRYESYAVCQSTSKQQSQCNHLDNFGIKVKDPLTPHKVHHWSGFDATSLFVMDFHNENEVVDLLYIGTASGHLAMVLVNQNVSKPDRYLDSVVMGEESVAREMAVNREQTSLYLVTGGKVVKVPIAACDIHTDCGACIASKRPTNCAWCNDKCRAAAQCERLPRQGKVCVPVIESVTPTSGPTTGGTKLTIRGANFGAVLPFHRRSPMDLALVKVGNKPCDILERTPHRIICLTAPGQASLLHDVLVEIADQSQFSISADISGTGVASNCGFQYKVVSLSSALTKNISPQVGIFSGGTTLTVHGQNLDVGSEASVFVGDGQCPIVQRQPDAIICTTPPWNVNYSQHFLPEMHELVHLPVTVKVDTLHLEAVDQFVYVVNPVIDEFQPTTSFASGGVPVQVKGKYLNVIQNPKMHVHVVGSGQNATVKCQASEDGSSMTCLSPPIDIATEADTLQFSGRHLKSLGLLTNVWFELDNIDTARYRPVMSDQSTLTYYLDPSFQDLGIHTFYMNETKLVLHGRNLQSLQFQEKEAIKVKLGHGHCEVTRIRSGSLVCTPRYDLDNFDYASDLLDVKVGVGNLLFEPGKLRLREHGKECSCACACG